MSHFNGATLDNDLFLDCDVCIVGSGAGGGYASELLSKKGLKVIVVEEGPYKKTKDFKMSESLAYPELYHESAARKSEDQGISILQGRCVGGGTTVNWTSSFRTPNSTLEFWQKEFGLNEFSEQNLEEHFISVEERFNIKKWDIPPNPNNQKLFDGLQKLNFKPQIIPRNVKDCQNLGYCGMGCPVGAKQSTLVTSIPEFLKNGGTLLSRFRAEKLIKLKDRIDSLEAVAMEGSGYKTRKVKARIKAKHFILSAGAIGSPTLMLKSDLPNPSGMIGKRTFLHPVSVTGALYDEEIDPFYGAPQSVYSDHFNQLQKNEVGFKLEVPPVHPVLISTALFDSYKNHREIMEKLPHLQVIIALLRDGFHESAQGGEVKVLDDGTSVLDYKMNDFLWDGVKRSLKTMTSIQFASGAKMVMPINTHAKMVTSQKEAHALIDQLPLRAASNRMFSAHVMGGSMMGNDPEKSVVNQKGRFHLLDNLFVMDGSVFPTSIGANPMESILSITSKFIADNF